MEDAAAEGADVLAVARDPEILEQLRSDLPQVSTLALDAADDNAPDAVLMTGPLDAIIIAGGAIPPTAPLQDLEWEEFSRNWNVDVKASFLFCKAALTRPLNPGSHVVLLSSGAAIGGSPISGGYSGAKRMQMFLAGFSQRESDRLKLDLRFTSVAPARIMQETQLGDAAIEGYVRNLGTTRAAFIAGMIDKQSASDVARAILEVLLDKYAALGSSLIVSGKGVEAVP